MADGDGGEAGSGRYRDRARAEDGGGSFNLAPLATAVPGSYPAFSPMGCPSASLPFRNRGGEDSENTISLSGLRHPAPLIARTSPSPYPVSITPSAYHMGGPSATPYISRPLPMGFPPTLPVVTITPAYNISHRTHPRSNLPSGLIEAGAAAASIAPFPSTSRRGIMDQAENASFPTNSTNFPSSNTSISFVEPPSVPENFPRDPVPQGGRGEGWPYAPQGWPKPDDKWGWRVGKRASGTSLWIDRYVTLPVSLLKSRRSVEFASRKSLAEYCRVNFPQMKDPYSIFKAFDWKVPAPKDFEASDKRGPAAKRDKQPPADGEENLQKSKKLCRAGNPDCVLSNAKDSGSKSLESLACFICCSESGFCRECKCILCCKFFRPDADDFSMIRCLNSPVLGQGICSHAAHLECALDSLLATVTKSKYGLDMEYVCRRCDRKTDLRETVRRLVTETDKTSTLSKLESSLQRALRTVQDPEDETRGSAKTQATFVGDSLKKVHEAAVPVDVHKGCTEQLHGLQAGRFRAMRRNKASEERQDHCNARLDNVVPQARGLTDSCVTPSTLFQNISKGSPFVSSHQGGSDDTSGGARRCDTSVVWHGGFAANGVGSTSGARLQPALSTDKDAPSKSVQSFPMPGDQVLFIGASQAPSEPYIRLSPSLSSLLDQSVCKPPTMSIEEHIRQCEAMADRVKGAGQLNTLRFSFVQGRNSSLQSLPVLEPRAQVLSKSQDASGYPRAQGFPNFKDAVGDDIATQRSRRQASCLEHNHRHYPAPDVPKEPLQDGCMHMEMTMLSQTSCYSAASNSRF